MARCCWTPAGLDRLAYSVDIEHTAHWCRECVCCGLAAGAVAGAGASKAVFPFYVMAHTVQDTITTVQGINTNRL
jgi:hypothetical protein